VPTAPESGARPQAQRHDSTHHGTSPTAAVPHSPATNKPSRFADSRILSSRSSSSFARHCASLASTPAALRACPPAPPPRLACRRLASGRLRHAWACLTRLLRQVEEGVSSASAVDTPSSKPRRAAKSESEARRRPGDLLRPSARDHHLETTTLRRAAHARRQCVRACIFAECDSSRPVGAPYS
jgi:hypothetical protein